MKLKIIPKVKKEREKLHKQKSNSSLSGKKGRDYHRCLFVSTTIVGLRFRGIKTSDEQRQKEKKRRTHHVGNTEYPLTGSI